MNETLIAVAVSTCSGLLPFLLAALWKMNKKLIQIEENNKDIESNAKSLEAFATAQSELVSTTRELKMRLNGLPQGYRDLKDKMTRVETHIETMLTRQKEFRENFKEIYKKLPK